MARQGVVAMDFLGVGKSPETGPGSSYRKDHVGTSITLVRPTPSLPGFQDHTPCSHNLSAGGGGGSSPMGCLQPAGFMNGRGWALPESNRERSVPEGAPGAVAVPPQKTPNSAERSSLDKPLQELTEADIMQLTREDCRRYLKERGMRRPSWNKFQAIQQVLSLKGLFDSQSPTEKSGQKEDSPKNSSEGASDATLPLLRGDANDVQEKSVTGIAKEVHDFFGRGKQGFGTTTLQRAGMFSDGQCHPSRFMNEEGLFFPSNSTNLPPCSDLTLSLPAALGKEPLHFNNGGFGSPLPVFTTSKEKPGSQFAAAQSASLQNVQGRSTVPQGMQPSTDVGTRPGSDGGRPPTSQLTIFYAGSVNVYDEVPVDKARAIMLLAGNGKQWAASSLRHPLAGADHPLPAPPCLTMKGTVHANPSAGDHPKEGISPPASIVMSSVGINQAIRRPHTELPQAKKASLQRFLEKRKERALSKAPYLLKKPDAEDSSGHLDRARDMSASISKSFKVGSASPLPFPQQSLSAAPSSWPSQSCGSENSSLRPGTAELMFLNSDQKGYTRSEVEKSETVNLVDEKMTEDEEDAASSQE